MNASRSLVALGALSLSLFALACSGGADPEPSSTTGSSEGALSGVVSPRDPASGVAPNVGVADPGGPSTNPGPGSPSTGGAGGGTCVQTVLCAKDAHFDSVKCVCVPNGGPSTGCVERFACTAFDHWDEALCKCVSGPSTPGTGGTPSGPSNPSTGAGKQCIKAPCL